MLTFGSALVLVVASQATWGEPLEWPDGAVVRRCYVSPVFIAELDGTDETARRLKVLAPEAVVVAAQAKVRMWRVPDAKGLQGASGLQLVPVLHDGKSTRAQQRVAVGGVLVRPKDGSAAATAQLAQRVRGEVRGSLIFVPTAPSVAAFAVAKELAHRDDVASATPNWWYPAKAK